MNIQCSICKSECANEDAKLTCSKICEGAETFQHQLTALIEGTRPSDDPRIFFFPLTFGELCDKYGVMSLRRCFAKSPAMQQKLDYRIFKLKRSIETHMAQLSTVLRGSIAQASKELFSLNAHIWRLHDKAILMGTDALAVGTIYFEMEAQNRLRLAKIRELDEIVGHVSTSIRIDNGDTVYP